MRLRKRHFPISATTTKMSSNVSDRMMETAIRRLEKLANQEARINQQEALIEEQEMEILELKARISDLEEQLRQERLRVKRLDFPDTTALRNMKKSDLETLRKETYDTWLWGSVTVDPEELRWRLGEIVKAMSEAC